MTTTAVTNAINATSAANTAASSNSVASANAATNAAAQQSLNSSYTDFLSLLTTQLQNQDPTAPADTNQITQEIAQLDEVQGQLQTNTYLSQLINLFSATENSNAVSYIGKQVDASGSPAQTELTGSQATLVYNLPAGTSTATVTITNASGQTVYSAPGTTIAGRNEVIWDGTTNTTGVIAPDGTYNFTVTAANSSGGALTATMLTSGTVTAVNSQNGATTLSLGGISVPIGNVTETYAAGTNPGS